MEESAAKFSISFRHISSSKFKSTQRIEQKPIIARHSKTIWIFICKLQEIWSKVKLVFIQVLDPLCSCNLEPMWFILLINNNFILKYRYTCHDNVHSLHFHCFFSFTTLFPLIRKLIIYNTRLVSTPIFFQNTNI